MSLLAEVVGQLERADIRWALIGAEALSFRWHPGAAMRKLEFRKRRVALEGAVRVTPRSGAQPKVLKYTDLSMGGLFVKSRLPPEAGTTLDIELRLMGLPFKATACVAWVRHHDEGPDKPTGMGIRFQELSTVQKKALNHVVVQAIEEGGAPMRGTPPSPADPGVGENSQRGESKKGALWSWLTTPLR